MRNFTDITGYCSTPADERHGLVAGLLAGALVVAAAVIGTWL